YADIVADSEVCVVCAYLFLSVFFFFSSRRRHTRCLSDWSSDVCSSDLGCQSPGAVPGVYDTTVFEPSVLRQFRTALATVCPQPRSEERRVGKECRSRGSAQELDKSGGERLAFRGTADRLQRGGSHADTT